MQHKDNCWDVSIVVWCGTDPNNDCSITNWTGNRWNHITETRFTEHSILNWNRNDLFTAHYREFYAVTINSFHSLHPPLIPKQKLSNFYLGIFTWTTKHIKIDYTFNTRNCNANGRNLTCSKGLWGLPSLLMFVLIFVKYIGNW